MRLSTFRGRTSATVTGEMQDLPVLSGIPERTLKKNSKKILPTEKSEWDDLYCIIILYILIETFPRANFYRHDKKREILTG